MTAQELLEALNKAQIETNLDQVAVWALIKYLQGAWKDTPGKNIRPFDLGQVLSDFFVDLSQHRLPEKITKQTPQTETRLQDFFGTAEGSKTQFWTKCIEIWSVTLEHEPAYAKEVKKYFDLLLASSFQGKRRDAAVAPIRTVVARIDKPLKPHIPTSTDYGTIPQAPIMPPASSSPAAFEPPVEPSDPVAPAAPSETPAPVAAESIKDFDKVDGPVPAAGEPGSEAPVQAPVSVADSEPITMPRNAYLVLQGTRVIPLNRPLIKIGRQLDNHIILEDPRVSRSHAQIKLINERFVIFDMNSTGGTFVNGQPASQSVLYPGDVVSLAGVVFIFSQEMPARPGDMKIIELGSPYAADRPTAIIHRDEINTPTVGPKDLVDLPKTGPL